MVPLWWYIVLGVVLFVIGAAGVLLRRNILVVLMSLELLLNSVNINFIAFGHYYDDFRGQIFAIFVIAITAAEVAVALCILVALARNKATLKVDEVTMMKGYPVISIRLLLAFAVAVLASLAFLLRIKRYNL